MITSAHLYSRTQKLPNGGNLSYKVSELGTPIRDKSYLNHRKGNGTNSRAVFRAYSAAPVASVIQS